nr:uncharacterized protein LOC109978775 [Labrus bergylta]
MLTLTHEERDHSEAQLLNEHQPISNSSHDAEDQDPTGSEHINKGLTSAEDKFVVSKNTNVAYEGGIDWKSRLLDIVWKPHIYLNRIDVPQQHVCKEEEEVLVNQQLCNQERNSSPDQEEPEPPQIEEEQEEHCSSQEGEQLVLKETDTSMLTLTHEERDHSEAQLLNEHQPISNSSHDAEEQDPKGSELGDSESTRNSEPKKKLPKRRIQNTKTSDTHCNLNVMKSLLNVTRAANLLR